MSGTLHPVRQSFALWLMGFLLTAAFGFQLRANPINDGFASATQVVVSPTGETLTVTSSNVGATAEAGEPKHAGETAAKSVWWKFTAQETASMTIYTAGSSFDTLLGGYTGTALTNLAVVAENDDSGAQLSSSVLFRAIAGETYYIAVDGVAGSAGSIQLSFSQLTNAFGPLWELTDVFGKPLRYSDFANKVVLIDFWETICEGCIDEIPQLIVLQERYRKAGFQILGLYKNSGGTNEVQQFMRNFNMNYPVAELTPEVEELLSAFQPTPTPTIQTFPTKYLYDRENRLVFQVLDGAKTLALYEQTILPLLRTGSSVKLQTTMDSGFIKLAWPGGEVGYMLEGSDTLSTNGWSTVLQINGERSTYVNPSTGNRFFRLRKTDQ